MRIPQAALTASLILAASGCIMPDQLAQYQKDVTDVQQKLAAVSRSQAEVAARMAALEAKSGGDDTVKRAEIADLRAQLESVVRQTTATSDKVDQMNGRIDRVSQEAQGARDAARRQPAPSSPLSAPAGEAVLIPAPPPAAGSQSPNALYTSAYADFSKGNYSLAVSGFEEYAERYPDTELADNAMYWIGECHFSQGGYKAAIDAFDDMLEKYPRSDKAAAANLKKALAFVQMNQIGQGIEQLRFVTANFPGTDEARIASDRLQSLGKP